ncbi:hypothetical protein B0H16DRAFT_1516867 [Mycena metata]|uniref:Polyketide synthase-like phosphopantetheine-binding domain-containing protein n=1 Tax=Mycena metata TaxID=1033252 RepID=A0AAD7NPF0_9AGAR|nr:hypothetical protein B0H16DRAFT_1516867 [Mycena metata]
MVQPRLLPRPPQTQALRSETFSPPPLDGTLTIAQIYDWHFRHTPSHPLFLYARQDGSSRTIYWPEAVQAIYVGTRILRDRFDWTAGTTSMPVVAILSSSDVIPYFTVLMSCLRANYVPFPVSPRNSPSAVAHLIFQAGVSHLLVGLEAALLDFAKRAIDILQESHPGFRAPDMSYVPLFDELFLSVPDDRFSAEALPFEYMGPDATACIVHSSGSTAFPKPIYWTNHRTIETSLIPWFGGRDLTGQIFSLHSMPMYHGMGIFQMFWSAACGLVLSAFEPKSPPTIPTPDNLFHAAKATNSDIIFCVPSFIEAWSRQPEYVKWLATRGGVLYGGGPLNKNAGDYMTSQGVSIFILYGSSEGGIMSPLLPREVGYDWEYFEFPNLVAAEMIPCGNNTFELVMVANDFCRPAVLNTKIRGIDAYATSDLLVPHPSKPGYWKVYGRTDDQIMHSTGEKTNPGPLENILNQDPHVLSSVMFGRGRFQAGVVVDPKDAFKFDPSDSAKLAQFRNTIWATVEKLNSFAPQHSRIFKEMILVSSPTKPFTYTAKNTARRQAIIADYEIEIDAVYATVEETTQAGTRLEAWDSLSTLEFVREVVRSVMSSPVEDEDDIFQHGCDSLQATWIRNSLLHALRDSARLDTRENTHNFVYDYPTISRLAEFLCTVASGTQGHDASTTTKTRAMHDMVAKYTQDFPLHTGEQELSPSTGKVVLVTGTTGELGCYLLARLLEDNDVVHVYSLNRRSSTEQGLPERQSRALHERGLDANILNSRKLSLLEGDTAKAGFDIDAAVYHQMQQSVTHIIHNAWPVDFNLALRSFESNIRGLRNLLDFSLGSPFVQPPVLLYTSTIGILQNLDAKERAIEELVDAESAVGSGYLQSKWVAEQILARAAESTPSKPTIVRVGQLSGGMNGAWNSKEWVPAIVQSAKVVQCIPDDHRDVTWLPVHVAAAAIVDFLDSPPSMRIMHLVNPHPISWSSLANILAKDLGVALVSYATWLARVQDAAKTPGDAKVFRAARLLGFFQSLADKNAEADAFGFHKLAMTNAFSCSPALGSADCRLGGKDVKAWTEYWRSVGLV